MRAMSLDASDVIEVWYEGMSAAQMPTRSRLRNVVRLRSHQVNDRLTCRHSPEKYES